MSDTKILVVDDEPVVTESCRRIFTNEGYEVVTANSGLSGLTHALYDDFDLVITDLKMPDLDGMELVRSLAAERPNTAIVIITAYGTEESAAEATKLGAADYIRKPFTPNEIAEAAASALTCSEPHAEKRRGDEATDLAQLKPIPISASSHHVHLTQEHVEALFGPGHTLTWHADLSQPGQFACKEKVALIGPKDRIVRVRVLGPVRSESQVEIVRTEQFRLGLEVPVRMSGDLRGTPGIILEGPQGDVRLEQGLICAMRHIHMLLEDAEGFGVGDHDIVRVRVSGKRSLVFGNVAVRVSRDYRLDMHIDSDEANAAGLGRAGMGYLDGIQALMGASRQRMATNISGNRLK